MYTIKEGLIRVIDQGAALRTLLKGHAKPVVDLSFFSHNSDVLASVGLDGRVNVWRVYDKALGYTDAASGADREIGSECLLRIEVGATSIVWHPFDPNRFMLVCQDGVVAVDTTRLRTKRTVPDEPFVCTPDETGELGALMPHMDCKVREAAFGKDPTFAVTGDEKGTVRCWRLAEATAADSQAGLPVKATCIRSFQAGSGPVAFLGFTDDPGKAGPSGSDLVVGVDSNRTLTLWSSPLTEEGTSSPPKLHQSLTFGSASSDMCVALDGTGEFLCVAATNSAELHVVHIADASRGASISGMRFDCVSSYKLTQPILSWAATNATTEDDHHDPGAVGEERGFEINLFCVQTKAIQLMKVRPGVCYNEGIVEARYKEAAAAAPTSAPAPTPAPTPAPAPAPAPAAVDPLSNWLGAIIDVPTPAQGDQPPVDIPLAEPDLPPAPAPAPAPAPTPAPAPAKAVAPPPAPAADDSSALLSPSSLLAKIGAPAPTFDSTHPEKREALSPARKPAKVEAPRREPATPVVKVAAVEQKNQIDEGALLKGLEGALNKSTSSIQSLLTRQLTSEMMKVGKAVTKSIVVDGEKTRRETVASVKAGVKPVLVEAFAETVEKSLVPAFQAGIQEMLVQIQASVDKGLAKVKVESAGYSGGGDSATTNKLLSEQNMILREQLRAMTTSVGELTKKVAGLEDMIRAGNLAAKGREKAAPAAGDAAEPQSAEDKKKAEEAAKVQEIKSEVEKLMSKSEFESAFMTALSASKVEIALFACGLAQLERVFHGDSGCLVSQTVLVCLMQQLGSSLVTVGKTSFALECEWLKEVLLCIDPNDQTIGKHVDAVKMQLAKYISKATENLEKNNGPVREKRNLQMLAQMTKGI